MNFDRANSPYGVSAKIFAAAAVDVTALDCVGGGLRRRVALLGCAEAPFGHVAGVDEGILTLDVCKVIDPEIIEFG